MSGERGAHTLVALDLAALHLSVVCVASLDLRPQPQHLHRRVVGRGGGSGAALARAVATSGPVAVSTQV